MNVPFREIFNRKGAKLKEITLRNDAVVPDVVLMTTSIAIETLLREDPIAFFEFVQKCRNPNHVMFGNIEARLINKTGLMSNGEIHSATRDCVLALVKGEDFEMELLPINEAVKKG